jgi:hypothetical protein
MANRVWQLLACCGGPSAAPDFIFPIVAPTPLACTRRSKSVEAFTRQCCGYRFAWVQDRHLRLSRKALWTQNAHPIGA